MGRGRCALGQLLPTMQALRPRGRTIRGCVAIAGPDALPFDELVRQYLEAKHDPRTVVRDEQALYFGTTLEKGSLVPAGKSLLGSCHFADWLSRTAQQK